MRVLGMMAVVILALALGVQGAPRPAAPTVDGRIGEREYARTLRHEASGMTLYWSIVGDTVYMGLRGDSDGWIGIGLMDEKTNRKAGADKYTFTMENGRLVAYDLFQVAPVGAPVRDEDRGGRNSVAAFAGSRSGRTWTVEFSRKLRTGDPTDVEIRAGRPVILILAVGPDMNWRRAHTVAARWEVAGFTF
jgi:hypothetical protein